jgi:hypothetical protein
MATCGPVSVWRQRGSAVNCEQGLAFTDAASELPVVVRGDGARVMPKQRGREG